MKDIFQQHGLGTEPILMLAPMEGVTNPTFRELICKVSTPDFVATEFVRITGSKQKIPRFPQHRVPLQIQFMATDADILRACILRLKEQGILTESDWLDLNVGCPSKRTNAHGAGAALLLDLPRLKELLYAMREAHTGPLSMKTRLGYTDTAPFEELLRVLRDCPLDFITLHARTRCAGYDQPIQPEYLSKAAQALPFPVIGNGDIWDAQDAQRMLDQTGVRGVMCGRGAISNPYLFSDIRQLLIPSAESGQCTERRKGELAQFALQLCQAYQEEEKAEKKQLVGVFKEFSVWLSKNPLVGAAFFQRIKRLQTLSEISQEIKVYFKRLSQAQDLAVAEGQSATHRALPATSSLHAERSAER